MVSTNNLYERPIPEELEVALGEYRSWNARHVASEQKKTTVTVPLYKYSG